MEDETLAERFARMDMEFVKRFADRSVYDKIGLCLFCYKGVSFRAEEVIYVSIASFVLPWHSLTSQH